jgi:Mce-associated membrane protein
MPSRERPRPTRRRIAGERTRQPDGAPAEAHAEPGAAAGTDAPTEQPTADEPTAATAEEPPPREPAPDEPAPAAPAAPAVPAREPADRGGPPPWVLAVLAGLLVVALALDGFVLWREISQRQEAEDRARALHSALIQAPSVAERAAESVLSFRHDTIDTDVAEARRFLTADYAPAYIRSIRDVVADPAGEVRATVRAEVLSSGVVEAGGQRADVLLFVNQVTRSADQDPQTALNRVVFTMVPREGTWKVDEIRAF